MAHELLTRLKTGYLALDWRKRQQARAAVKGRIETPLDQPPRKYGRRLHTRKCDEAYEQYHVGWDGERMGWQRSAL